MQDLAQPNGLHPRRRTAAATNECGGVDAGYHSYCISGVGGPAPLTADVGPLVHLSETMRRCRSVLVVAILALQPVCAFAPISNFGTNAEGEKIYVPQLRREILLPVATVVVGLSLAALIARVRRRGKSRVHEHKG